MVRIRKGWLVAMAVVGLGTAACKKNEDKKSADQPAADKTADKKAEPGGSPASAPSDGEDLSLLPADSEVVLGLNFAQLQQSALWKQFSPKLMEKMCKELADFKSACGFDIMTAFQSMSIGLKGLGGKPEGAIVVH